MRVLFVTSEMTGLYKRGGLADVSSSLPHALSRLGIHVTVVLPYYRDIARDSERCIGTLAVPFDGKDELVFLFLRSIGAVQVLLMRHPRLDQYQEGDIVERFAFFSQAVARLVDHMNVLFGKGVDVVHCQDWHTALIPLILGERNKLYKKNIETVQSRSYKTILTIHNLLYQGITSVDLVKKLGIPLSRFDVKHAKDGDQINILREGIEYSDKVTTVSPTYAQEILTSDFGERVNKVLAHRKGDLEGILNGIDEKDWNPNDDEALDERYTMKSFQDGKMRNKKALLASCGLAPTNDMLFAYVGRLEAQQKGLDILVHAIESLLGEIPFSFVLLGKGNGVNVVRDLVKKSPKRIALKNIFDESLARRVYAGADAIIVPSKFEPCGLIQMIAMRYGTIPIVRHTGGLADSVKDRKTGFVFRDYLATALKKKLVEAHTVFQTEPEAWRGMVEACMREDFSWDRSAIMYTKLYKAVLR